MGLLNEASKINNHDRTDSTGANGFLRRAESAESIPKDRDKKKNNSWLGPGDIGLFGENTQSSFKSAAESHQVKPEGDNDRFAPDIHTLLWNAERIEKDLTAPGEVFALAAREFRVQKGVLLVPRDTGDSFAPFSIKGYDKTTEHRLRIPYGLLAETVSLQKGYTVLRGSEITSFSDFFSNREFSVIEEILLIPLQHGDTISAAFIITDSPILGDSGSLPADLLSFSQEIGELIYHSRNTTLENLSAAEVKSRHDVLNYVEETIERIAGTAENLSFFLVSLSDFIDLLRHQSEHIDSYRLREDTIRIISSMMPESVSVFSVDHHVLLILMPGKFHINTALLIHQIKVGLQSLFKIGVNSIDLHERSFVYPADVSDSQAIIEKIFNYAE